MSTLSTRARRGAPAEDAVGERKKKGEMAKKDTNHYKKRLDELLAKQNGDESIFLLILLLSIILGTHTAIAIDVTVIAVGGEDEDHGSGPAY